MDIKCDTCQSNYKAHNYYQHTKSVKHLASINKYYCKPCNEMCNIDEKENHLKSEEHLLKNENLKSYCDTCNKKVSKLERHKKSIGHINLEKAYNNNTNNNPNNNQNNNTNNNNNNTNNNLNNNTNNNNQNNNTNNNNQNNNNNNNTNNNNQNNNNNNTNAKPRSIDLNNNTQQNNTQQNNSNNNPNAKPRSIDLNNNNDWNNEWGDDDYIDLEKVQKENIQKNKRLEKKERRQNKFLKIIKIELDEEDDVEQIVRNEIKKCNYPRFKYRVLAWIKYGKGEENIDNCSISDWLYNHEQFVFNNWQHQIENEELRGSGLEKKYITQIEIEIYKIKEIKASSWIELPPEYKNSKSILNIENNDQYCFIWSILAHLHPAKNNSNKIYNYKPFFHNLNLKDLDFPMSINQIPKFEKQNGLNINVFELEEDTLIPIYVNENYSASQIDLMLYHDHYCLITKLHTLISDNHHLKCICRRCLNTFGGEGILNDHIELCQNFGYCKIEFPVTDCLYFNSYHTKIDIPIRVYADFECFNLPQKEIISNKTKILFKHEPCSVGYYLISPWQTGYKSYTGSDCDINFVQDIFEIEKKASEYFDTSIDLKMTPENKIDFQNSKVCWLCDKKFEVCLNQENCKQKKCECKKVRDHDHLSGKFRGAAHKICSLNVQQDKSNFVPVLFHNFSGYDCHLIFEKCISKAFELGFQKHHIKIIPKTIENFISLQIGCLRFLDSYRFLQSSLDKLAQSLNDFPIMKSQQLDDSLLLKKLAYAYEYFSESNFDQPLDLKKEHFYSTLKQSYPPQQEIDRTFEIIKKYNIKTGKELTLMYNKLDVLLLADIFENFIKKCMEVYKINPLYCYSAPSFTWKAFFKFSNTKIDYIKDHKLLLLIETNIRGGISGVMGDRCIKSDQNTKILYIDANNLYGWAMSQYMPIGNFLDLEINDENEKIILDQIINTSDQSDNWLFFGSRFTLPSRNKTPNRKFSIMPT